MRWIFYGTALQLISLTMDINGIAIRILPLCVCFFLIMKGCAQMAAESTRFDTGRTVYFAVALCALVAEAGALIGVSFEILSAGIWIADLCGRYLMVRGIQDMEGRYGDLGGASLITAWKAGVVCSLLRYPLALLGINILLILLTVAALCAAIWFATLLYHARMTYEERQEQVFGARRTWGKDDDLL